MTDQEYQELRSHADDTQMVFGVLGYGLQDLLQEFSPSEGIRLLVATAKRRSLESFSIETLTRFYAALGNLIQKMESKETNLSL